jgi:hypothetical protein
MEDTMPYLLVRLQVKDYAAWRPLFDAQAARRGKGGDAGREE